MDTTFTGECFIPGKGSKTTEEEHFERYKFAATYAAGKRVLDIACGVGYGSKILAEAGALSVLGCDILQDNIAYAMHNYKGNNIDFKVKDATKPILEGKFDLIVSFETIEHVDDFSSALINLYDALKAAGELIISSPNRKITNPYIGPDERTDAYHVREFTIDEFRANLVKSGFRNLELYGQRQQRFFNNPFLEKHYKRLFKPSKRTSPKVKPVKEGLEPKHFVFTGVK
jgi:SAM-dependent methyltransferase